MDKIIRSLICDGQVSLTVLETRDLVNEAIKIHRPTAKAAEILGGLLTCGAYLAAGLKDERGCVSLTVKAKDGDGAVSVSADGALRVRGYADGSCENTLVGGTLTVVREDGYSQPFVGTCEILSDDVSDILETYFGQSEQIATAAAIEVKTDGESCVSAGGVVMQLMPDASDEAIWEATDVFDQFKSRESITKRPAEPIDAQKIFDWQFAPYSSGEVVTVFPEYRCNCSEEKIRGVLASVGKAELLKICEELGEVKVHCHYCNRDYIYGKARIEEIF
ncbi:MAG: Hsp33 family molecular chaperone HslO [Clostridiales bacterium]|nr:Hsp33 family molecular chaperone HslO [Clostridiales bacterium]